MSSSFTTWVVSIRRVTYPVQMKDAHYLNLLIIEKHQIEFWRSVRIGFLWWTEQFDCLWDVYVRVLDFLTNCWFLVVQPQLHMISIDIEVLWLITINDHGYGVSL